MADGIPMKIVTIGGTGFIGHELSKDLSEQGHEIIAIDNHSGYGLLDRNELAWLLPARLARMPLVKFIKADVNDRTKIKSLLLDIQPDCIVYLAAFPRAKAVDDNLVLASDTMITSLTSVAEIAKKMGSKFLFISSSMVYGEWPSYEIDESHKPDPTGMYGNLKYLGEQILRHILPESDLLITRLTGVYGPWDATDRVVSKMFRSALRDDPIIVNGVHMMLDLTYITDTVSALATGINKQASGLYNISSGTGTTLFELACDIHRITQSESEIVTAGADPRYKQRGALNHSKATRDLNYSPKTDLERGLTQYLEWLTIKGFVKKS
jgi:nucleoside-diphosphate-sugar epimerase